MYDFFLNNEALINIIGMVSMVVSIFTHDKYFRGGLNTAIAFVGAGAFSLLLLSTLINGIEKGF